MDVHWSGPQVSRIGRALVCDTHPVADYTTCVPLFRRLKVFESSGVCLLAEFAPFLPGDTLLSHSHTSVVPLELMYRNAGKASVH